MPGPVVFISYSHDSDEHRERVLGLAARLRRDGLETRLDQEVNGTPEQGWPRWMLDQLDEADFVLVVCTETYYRRFRGHEEPGRGKGADWEGALITQELYNKKSRTAKFVPVMLSAGQGSYIPDPLRAHTYYELTSDELYQALYAFLLGQAGATLCPPGPIKPVSKKTAEPLSFGSSLPSRPTMIGVPHRNHFFTGRETLLSHLHQRLQTQATSTLAQAALCGLGGIGKSQIAIEYAHRFGKHYRFILWVVAEDESAIQTTYLSFARQLGLVNENDIDLAVLTVKDWLAGETDWLLVFDNADDPAMVRPYLPPTRAGGNVLLTSRAKSFAQVGIREPISVETLEPEAAARFLIERTCNAEAQAAAELAAELGYLPLALEQAAAYIETVGGSFTEYLAKYRQQGIQLLEKGRPSTDYSKTVATTWSLSFDAVREISPTAATLLTFAAFLAPDSIPIEIFVQGVSTFTNSISAQKARALLRFPTTLPAFVKSIRHNNLNVVRQVLELSAALTGCSADKLLLWELFAPLERYSLIKRLPEADAFLLHRLTQEVIRDSLSEKARRTWVSIMVLTLNEFSHDLAKTGLYERLRPHVRLIAELARDYNVESGAAAHLFNAVGSFAMQRKNYLDAKLFAELSVKVNKRTRGNKAPLTLKSSNNLAVILGELGDFHGARNLIEKNLKVQKRVLGDEHPDTLKSRELLASTLYMLGDLAGANKLRLQNFESRKREGDENLSTLQAKNDLAHSFWALGDLARAKDLFDQALNSMEHILGSEDPRTLQTRCNLATTLRGLGDLEGSRTLHEQTLEACERVLGNEHPCTTIAAWNLLQTVLQLGDSAAAGKLIKKLLWLLDRDEASISFDQRRIRQTLLRVFNSS